MISQRLQCVGAQLLPVRKLNYWLKQFYLMNLQLSRLDRILRHWRDTLIAQYSTAAKLSIYSDPVKHTRIRVRWTVNSIVIYESSGLSVE